MWKKENISGRGDGLVQGRKWEKAWHVQENVSSSIWLGHRAWDTEWLRDKGRE